MIGIIDSGIGGFGIYTEVKRLLPMTRAVYVADQVNFPYGGKSESEIERCLMQAVEIAVSKGADLVVIACNSASVSALDHAREKFHLPIVGTVPAIKPAATLSPTKRIGVIGTERTIASDVHEELVKTFGEGCDIIAKSCPGLAARIESLDDPTSAINECIDDLQGNIDTLVLACTHYPLVASKIQEMIGPSVRLLDVNEAVARRTRDIAYGHHFDDNEHGKDIFVTTGDEDYFSKQILFYHIDRVPKAGYTVQHTTYPLR